MIVQNFSEKKKSIALIVWSSHMMFWKLEQNKIRSPAWWVTDLKKQWFNLAKQIPLKEIIDVEVTYF